MELVMTIRGTHRLAFLALFAAVTCGCGGGREIPEPIGVPEAVYANSIRASIEDIQTAENPAAAVENAQYALENMEGYEEQEAAAEHLETYRQIHQKFEEVRQMRNPSHEEIAAKVEELDALAAQLPRMESAASAEATPK